jgi:4-amino-4-deoxy-L-arabinose transferase-like glycosyltransferase
VRRTVQVSRARAAWLVVAAAAVPRLIVLAIERDTILEEFVEKSDRFARTFVDSGTFGFLPDVPSAYTQPLYAFFLSGLYWPFGRSWIVVGLAQTLVAVVTALLVFEIGRRLRSVEIGLAAALIATLHPYVVWHDVHVNREILDGLVLVSVTLLALLAFEQRSLSLAAASGAVAGVGILGNSRLSLLPLGLAVYVAWRARPFSRALLLGGAVVVAAAVVVVPWLVRNEVAIGCPAITTDARALWKANNPATYDVLARGQWIDDVPELPGAPPWPELAADRGEAAARAVDECAQVDFYTDEVVDFWRDEPGEKARLAAQAARMLWQPTFTVEDDDEARGGVAEAARSVVEPAFMIALYGLALAGAFFAPGRFLALVLLLEAYNTLTAMVFAGTVRYRTPFDFLLALLAAFALERVWARWRQAPTRARASAAR